MVMAELRRATSPRQVRGIIEVIVRRWALSDADATGAWVNSLPEGPLREKAVESLVGIVDGFDVGLAWKWALTISDPEKRITQMGNFRPQNSWGKTRETVSGGCMTKK